MQTKNTKQGGFTLVEIAIVLVIIGLLLGGILKGQELINNAKVRSVADRQNSLKAAWFGFIDRYNFIPGDSARARQLVPGASKRTDTAAGGEAGNGRLTVGESVAAMQQLTGAGFLRCPQCNGGLPAANRETAGNPPNAENSLVNQYSGVMSIWNDSLFYSEQVTEDGSTARDSSVSGRLQIHSGPRIPSNILSEVDRKIDDGVANTGDMVFNFYDPTTHVLAASAFGDTATGAQGGNAPDDGECTNAVVDFEADADGEIDSLLKNFWRTADRDPAVVNNCGASVFI